MKKYKSGSALYRAAYAEQTEYLDQLDDLFPWVDENTDTVSEEKGSEGKGCGSSASKGNDVTRSVCGAGTVDGTESAVNVSPSRVQFEWYVHTCHCTNSGTKGHPPLRHDVSPSHVQLYVSLCKQWNLLKVTPTIIWAVGI